MASLGNIVGFGAELIDVTLSVDTSAYGSGDLIADTQVVTGAMRLPGGTALLHSISVLDEDDQGVAFSVVFLQNSTSLGTENGAPNISDANLRSNVLCVVPVAAADYTDFGGAKVATVGNLNRLLKAASGSKDIYVAVINSTGTPTYTASGLKLRIGLYQN